MKCRLFIISFIIIISSCSSVKYATRNESGIFDQKEDSIVFITLKIWRDSIKSKNCIAIVDISKTKGKLKKAPANMINGNFLNCIIYNSENNTSESFKIQHPLYREVEFIDINNQFSRKSIKLDESDFFVRFAKQDYTSLKIVEYTSSLQNQELINIKL